MENRADYLRPYSPFAVGDLAYAVLGEIHEGRELNFADATSALSLWGSDGTRLGTASLLPEGVSLASFFGPPDTLGGVLFFVACEHGDEIPKLFEGCPLADYHLWRTDGTLAGTFPLPLAEGSSLEIAPKGGSVPELGQFYFVARNQEDLQIVWRTDGTPEGTRPALDLKALGLGSPSGFESFHGELLFTAFTSPGSEGARQVSVLSDGTAAGTKHFLGPFEGEGRSGLVVTEDRLYALVLGPEFIDPPLGSSTWRFTLWGGPGPGSLEQLADLGFWVPTQSRIELSGAGGKAFVELSSEGFDANFELWGSDGSPASSGLLVELLEGFEETGGHFELFEEAASLPGGSAFLRMWDEDHGWEPWASDGTPAGTRRLADLCPGPCSSFPWGQAAFQESYLFVADDSEHGKEMWRWNPRTDQVSLIGDVCTGECTEVEWLAGSRGDVVFVETRDDEGEPALWSVRSDGTDVRRVTDLAGFEVRVFRTILETFGVSTLLSGYDWIFWARDPDGRLGLWSVPLPADAGPPPPPRDALSSDELTGFDIWVEITPGSGEAIPGRAEPDCIPETLCVSGAVQGRPEVFVRIVGPKPNGRFWPTLVKFSTSTVEVWIRQQGTGLQQYYRLEGASPGSSELPGLFDRDGFPPM